MKISFQKKTMQTTPQELPPAFAAILAKWSINNEVIAAMLVDLVQRGILSISGDRIFITYKIDFAKPYEQAFVKRIFGEGESLHIEEVAQIAYGEAFDDLVNTLLLGFVQEGIIDALFLVKIVEGSKTPRVVPKEIPIPLVGIGAGLLVVIGAILTMSTSIVIAFLAAVLVGILLYTMGSALFEKLFSNTTTEQRKTWEQAVLTEKGVRLREIAFAVQASIAAQATNGTVPLAYVAYGVGMGKGREVASNLPDTTSIKQFIEVLQSPTVPIKEFDMDVCLEEFSAVEKV